MTIALTHTITGIISKFADDTKVGRVVANETDREELQREIDKLVEWTMKWQMEFNASKCKVVHFGKKNPGYTYTMGGFAPAGVVLEAVEEEKDVGVMVTNNLKPSIQCAKAAKKANQVLGQMARALHYRDKHVWIKLYKTYVRCHLEYCIQAWSPWTVADRDVLEAVQRRAVRMVSGLEGKSYEDRLQECGLTSLEDRRQRGDMIEVWKILHGQEDVDPRSLFTFAGDNSVQKTRSSSFHLNVVKPRFKSDLRKNFFSVRTCDKWNDLPNSIRESSSLNNFKNNYDKWVAVATSSNSQ